MWKSACVVVVVGTAPIASAQTRTVDFGADSVGEKPAGFVFAHTAQVGDPGNWVVRAEGSNKFVIQTDADQTRARFPVAVLTDLAVMNVDVSVRFKPISGKVDQAGGLVWRYRDENNYYLVRGNALENNVVLYKVENGKRVDLPLKDEGRTYGKKVDVPAGQWHTLRVVVRGPLFEVFFNGTKLYDVEDSTFTEPGRIGLWTKADSVTQFDDLTIRTIDGS